MSNLSRRAIVSACAFSALGVTTRASSQAPLASATAYSDRAGAERWMQSWIDAPGSITRPLYLGRFQDPTYFLLQDIGWQPSGNQKVLASVHAPTGFITDLTSIPRVFWSALRPDGNYAYAAILHDYLYWFQPFGRDDADLVLKYAMEDLGVESATVATVYSAVRVGGESAWKENKTSREGGEKRILVKYPDSPSITWANWKARQGVLK